MAPSDPPRRRRYLLAALAILGACAASFALGVRHGAHPEDALGVREMVGAAPRGPAACPAPKPCPPALEAGGRAEPRVVDPPACPACDPCSPAPRAATPRAPEPRLAAGGPPGRGGKDEAGDEGGEAAGAGESSDEGKRAVDASMGPGDDRKASPAASNGTTADEPTPRAVI